MKIDILKLFIRSIILFVLALVIADNFLDYTGVKTMVYALSLAIIIPLVSLGVDYIKYHFTEKHV
ncbi:ABC transporter permease [Bacillus toyonensis]|uniref:ABC transporter permease n=1 Tax=Bacillus toyonensis TaxID=155322 RepID=UPI000BEC8986|nr:ABC transporter permease [Bacillus toyonensis]PEA32978.1 ABC transporter permease [Bacillus toyonensis]PEB19678.1 ABC transporter permease [Bacillus toyonensis]PGA33288.1 ABC transporter permease [Bacillus toyonensis]